MATNKVLVLVMYFLYHISELQTSPLDDPDFGLNTVQMIENHGYKCETHTIITEDGYILTYHRIPHGKTKNLHVKKPVLIMHGLLGSSADFVMMGPNRSLGYILADRGYDVWLANARGNAWSRKHVKFDVVRNAKKFFDFSWHEIGHYDLPAAIDYILNVTGNSSLFYIAHSQGGGCFLVLSSTRPEYNAKIKLASLLAPAGYMENLSNKIIIGLMKIMDQLTTLCENLHIYEVPYISEIQQTLPTLCSLQLFYPTCLAILSEFSGADPQQFDQNKIAVFFTNAPSNAAMKQIIHYGQIIRDGGFSQYDYGQEQNLITYKQEKPAPYNLSKITTSVAVYFGKNDVFVNTKDAKNLIKKLPNVVRKYFVPHNLFSHLDHIVAKDVVKLLYVDLIELMDKQ